MILLIIWAFYFVIGLWVTGEFAVSFWGSIILTILLCIVCWGIGAIGNALTNKSEDEDENENIRTNARQQVARNARETKRMRAREAERIRLQEAELMRYQERRRAARKSAATGAALGMGAAYWAYHNGKRHHYANEHDGVYGRREDDYNDRYWDDRDYDDEYYDDEYQEGYEDGCGNEEYDDYNYDESCDGGYEEGYEDGCGNEEYDDYNYDESCDGGYEEGYDEGYEDGYNDNYDYDG